jgi:hypothetical protein
MLAKMIQPCSDKEECVQATACVPFSDKERSISRSGMPNSLTEEEL